ncbi:uncharacterized protein LOC130732440 [Lotus japonicus]|uniref:uncharacterized protein LOC130732440 n=1 Tax=Lotus japonicus TaxID=34305 RepID=UPI00258A18DB|nr:uncharacterized protein LOC130732440 [Lotus japonicus]
MDTRLSVIDHVTSIHQQGPYWSIKVRAIAVWRVPFDHVTLRPSCMDMILVDRFGTKIQGSVCRRHPPIRAMQTGRVYQISNFKVVLNDDIRLTPHQFRLIFHACTIIAESFDVRIPRNGWSLCNTQIIRNRSDEFTHLIDCLGVMLAASQEKIFIKDGQLTKMLYVDLQDTRGNIRCMVIGSLVNIVAEYLASNWTMRPVIVLQFVKVKSFRDKFLIEGTPVASKVLFNPDIEEAIELTQRMDALGFNYHGPVGFIRSDQPNLSLRDDMLNTHPRKTLTQLLDNKEGGIFIVHAGIVGVLKDGPWFYPSCRCFSELRVNGVKYDCLKCGRTIDKMINRFRFKVEVYDGVDSAVFVLHDPEAELIAGFSCEELMNSFELEKKVIPEGEYPDDIEDHIAGLEMLFKVHKKVGRLYGKEGCFEILRICTDLDIIAMFHDHDAIVTPDKAKFMPSFTKMGSAEGSCLTLSDKGHALSESHTIERGDRRLRRKLFIDFESEDEDVVAADFVAAEMDGKKHIADSEIDLNNDPKPPIAEIETKDDGENKSLDADGGRDLSSDGSPISDEFEVPKSGVAYAEGDAAKEMIDFIFDDDDLTGIVSDEESMEDSDSSEGEDMSDNLDECGLKYKVKIEPVDDDKDKLLKKVAEDDYVIVISDDDEKGADEVIVISDDDEIAP